MLYGVGCSWRTFYGNCWHIAIRLLIWLNRRTCLFKSRHTAFIFRVRIRFSFLLICPFYHFRKINSVILCDSRDFTIIRRLNTHKLAHQHIWFRIFQWVYFSLTAFNYFHEWSIVSFFVFENWFCSVTRDTTSKRMLQIFVCNDFLSLRTLVYLSVHKSEKWNSGHSCAHYSFCCCQLYDL